MGYNEIIMAVKEIGLPAAVLFYILIIGSKNQRDMTRAMFGMQRELSNLAVLMHDAITYMKVRGGV